VLQPGVVYYVDAQKITAGDALDYKARLILDNEIAAQPETEPNDTEADASAMTVGTPIAFSAAGTLVADGDVDWFKFTLPTNSLVSLNLGALDLLGGPSDTIEVAVFADDGSGSYTEIPMDGLTQLTAGDKLVKVSGAHLGGVGNSYVVTASVVSPTDLGTLTPGTLAQQTGTFGPAGVKLFTFQVPAGFPADGSRSVFVWSDAIVEVTDSSGAPVHTSAATSAGMSSTTLAPGVYTAKLTGAAGAEWRLFAGNFAYTLEAEQAGGPLNDTSDVAEDLGTLSAGATVHRFGSATQTDYDWFKFVVPDLAGDGSNQTVVIEEFTFGETISGYEEFYLHNGALDDMLDNVFYSSWSNVTALFATYDLAPGTYYLQLDQWGGDGSTTGDYLLRVGLAPAP
jgi:hypothetical protein